MKKTSISKVTTALANIIEVISFAIAGFIAISLIALAIMISKGQLTTQTFSNVFTNVQLQYQGGQALFKDGQFNIPGLFVFGITMIIFAILSGSIFHNIYRIFALDSGSPFSPENIKRVRTIGFLAITLPIAKIIITVIGMLFGLSAFIDISASEFLFGLVALSLSQYFAYGAKLEKDVEGLL